MAQDGARAIAVAESINRRQGHRGPDHAVVVPLGPFALGNTRLAIQDPTPAGNQPFRSSDGRYVCVFNGEIYNYLELIKRHQLQVPNQCDGAVIPELWRLLGPAALQELRGMFALALVDLTANELFLARDPFGIKPLYTRRLPDGTVAFGSEVRPLAMLDARPAVDPSVLTRFLQLGALAGDQSPFVGVAAVPPNTMMRLQADGTSVASQVVPGRHPLVSGGGAGELGAAFRSSVEVHLRSDVPSVLLLSSGVDAAAIASAARLLGHDLHCMTVGGFSGGPGESEGARTIASHYGHSHQVVEAEVDETAVGDFFGAMQRPTIDGLNTFIVCRAVQHAGFRVALSGLGGDEALGGYDQYRILPVLPALEQLDRFAPLGSALAKAATHWRGGNTDKIRRLVVRGGPRSADGLDLLQREVLPRPMVAALTGSSYQSAPVWPAGRRDYAAMVEAEVANYMQATLLPDADGFSMISSVELRVPFVDREVFTAAVRVNARRRTSAGKRALAEALRDPFLVELTRKRKQGFTVPMAEWLRNGPLAPLVGDARDTGAPVWSYLDRAVAQPLLAAPVADRWSGQWTLVALNAWLRSLDTDPVLAR